MKKTRYTPRSHSAIAHDKLFQHLASNLRSFASEGQDTSVAQVLKQAKLQQLDDIIDSSDQWGYTSLIEAAMWGHVDVIDILLQSNAQVQLRSVAGETALHWSAFNGHHQVVSLLLNQGHADPDAIQNKGQTPLHLAVEKNHEQVVRLLVEAGCDCSLADNKKKTAMDLALPNSNCAVLLQRHDPKKRVQLMYVEKKLECDELRVLKDRLVRKVKAQRMEIQRLKEERKAQQEKIDSLVSPKSSNTYLSCRHFLSRMHEEAGGGGGGGGGGERKGEREREREKEEGDGERLEVAEVKVPVQEDGGRDASITTPVAPALRLSLSEVKTPLKNVHSQHRSHVSIQSQSKVGNHQRAERVRATYGDNKNHMHANLLKGVVSPKNKSRTMRKKSVKAWSNNFKTVKRQSPPVARTFF